MTTVSLAVGLESAPEEVQRIFTLAEPDYLDVCTLETENARMRDAEGWARAVLEEAPVSRRSPRRLWRALGLRLGPPGSTEHVQGWRIVARHDDWVRVATRSWWADAEAVCLVTDASVSVGLCLRYRRWAARLVWRRVAPIHQRGLPVMVKQGGRVVAQASR